MSNHSPSTSGGRGSSFFSFPLMVFSMVTTCSRGPQSPSRENPQESVVDTKMSLHSIAHATRESSCSYFLHRPSSQKVVEASSRTFSMFLASWEDRAWLQERARASRSETS